MTQRQTTSGCENRPESLLRLRSRLGLTVLLLTTCLSPLSAQNGLLQLDDLRLETNLSDPLLSPDGNFAVVVASKPNYEDNRFDRSLVLVDLGDGARLDLTPHRPKVRLPRWSPDGRTIAFIDSGPDDEKPQLYLLPIRGGEARQLSQAAGGVETYAWSADGSHIYFGRSGTRARFVASLDRLDRGSLRGRAVIPLGGFCEDFVQPPPIGPE